MGRSNHSLSLDATIMVSKNCPIIDKHPQNFKASNSNIDKLQKVQNFAGRIILGLRKYDHISDGCDH